MKTPSTNRPVGRKSRPANRITFLHAADLHLGAPFRGLRAVSESWADQMVEAICKAYDTLIETALEVQVDFVVMAGDIFDTAKPTYADFLYFIRGLERLQEEGIPVYLIGGNHDPYLIWRRYLDELPANTTMLSTDEPGFACFESDRGARCMLAGRGYYGQAWSEGVNVTEGLTRYHAYEVLKPMYPELQHDDFAIGVIHTGLTFDEVHAPVSPAHLLNRSMDYWACGHLHNSYVYPDMEDPRIGFPGCIQGRDIREKGKRGVYLVTLDKGKNNTIQFVPTAAIAWDTIEIELETGLRITDVMRSIEQALYKSNADSQCEKTCARIKLTGATELHKVFEENRVLEDIRDDINTRIDSFFIDTIEDQTHMPFDKKALSVKGLFPAALLQSSSYLRSDREKVMMYLQDEFLARGLSLPPITEEEYKEIVDQAQDTLLDALLVGEKL